MAKRHIQKENRERITKLTKKNQEIFQFNYTYTHTETHTQSESHTITHKHAANVDIRKQTNNAQR